MQLEPLARKADKSASKVEGGMPLSVNLDLSPHVAVEGGAPLRMDLRGIGWTPGGSLSAVDEIDEID